MLVLLGSTGVWAAAGTESGRSLEDVISRRDQARLLEDFFSAEPYDEMETAYYILSGLDAFGFNDDNKQLRENACTYIKTKNLKDLRDIFYASSGSAILKDSCKVMQLFFF